MKLMTWNLQDGGIDPYGGADNRFWKELDLIAEVGPDVLFLQEARWWDTPHWSRLLTFEATTGMRAFLGQAKSGSHTMVAIASGHIRPLNLKVDNGIHHAHTKLTALIPGYPEPVVIASCHLNPFDGAARLMEATHIANLAERPSIVMGDMNCAGPEDPPLDLSRIPISRRSQHTLPVHTTAGVPEPDIPPVEDRRAVARFYEAGFFDAIRARAEPDMPPPVTAGHRTWGAEPPARFDHILLSPHLAPRLATGSYRVLDNDDLRTISHRLPVVAELVPVEQQEADTAAAAQLC